MPQKFHFRPARIQDLGALLHIEETCFAIDRLSQRSFRNHIKSAHSELIVAEQCSGKDAKLLGYGLVFCHKGTRLARLYSLAILPETRGSGLARKLLLHLEMVAESRGRHYMRLEVAKNNEAAIHLYQSLSYRVFGEYSDYYEDHSSALRMQKQIRKIKASNFKRITPWYQQSTEFSCGPASLMMAMASLNKKLKLSQALEIDIWREATTVFMTSGHGGSHPLGLALAAQKRGFSAEVFLNTKEPLFLDGVRTDNKKQIMEVVHKQFVKRCKENRVGIRYSDFTQAQVESFLKQNCAILMLISTYRLDGRKAPHWVVITGVDENCLYVHDPDPDEKLQQALDCQYVPIARDDFEKMSSFGTGRLRTAVVIKNN